MGCGRGAPLTIPPDDLQRRLAAFVKNNGDYAMFLLDAKGHILSWNEGARRIKGYEAEDILGHHFSRFYTLEDRHSLKPDFELKVAAQTGRYEESGWRVRKDGSMFWANVVITAQRDEKGGVVGYAKITRDMTERKQAEEAMRRSEERYRLLLDSVRDYAIFLLDASGRITSWNAGAERINGYTAREIVGEHFSVFYTPEDKQRAHPAWELAEALRQGRYEEEGWRARKDGTRFWASVIITAIRDVHGAHVGFAKVTRDLSERKKSMEAAEQSASQAREMREVNRELEAFSYTVAHDLKAPLRAIGGLAEIIEEEQRQRLDAEGLSQIQSIQRAAGRMERMVEDLLSLSRAARGDIHLQEIDVSAMARHVLAGFQERDPSRKVDVHVQQGMKAKADESLFRIVLDNLLGNAWKFTGRTSGARIEVTMEERRGERILHVRDNGAGFDPLQTELLFTPFQRLHSSRDFEGTGVGLASVRRIVERHGGRVWAQGEPGKGAAFSLAIPG